MKLLVLGMGIGAAAAIAVIIDVTRGTGFGDPGEFRYVQITSRLRYVQLEWSRA